MDASPETRTTSSGPWDAQLRSSMESTATSAIWTPCREPSIRSPERPLEKAQYAPKDGECVTDFIDHFLFHIPYPRMVEYASAAVLQARLARLSKTEGCREGDRKRACRPGTLKIWSCIRLQRPTMPAGSPGRGNFRRHILPRLRTRPRSRARWEISIPDRSTWAWPAFWSCRRFEPGRGCALVLMEADARRSSSRQ